VSLSQDPAFTALKDYFVCGTQDITNEPYCGISGRHEVDGNAINTTNGAGPHNIQMFMLSADGTVLTCLQGFWNASDLVSEMGLANQLNQVWLNPNLTRSQKNQMFSQMHMAHAAQHSQATRNRSRLQGFDAKYEAKNRLYKSDAILNPALAAQANIKGAPIPWEAFQTTDQLMHQRMAQRPFERYTQFDVAHYVDYGRQKYDKHEDDRDSTGQVDKQLAKKEQMIGNPTAMQANNKMQQRNSMGGRAMQGGLRRMLKYGIRAAL